MLELAADAGHVDAQVVGLARVGRTPDSAQQFGLANEPASSGREVFDDLPLGGGQVCLFPV